MSSKWRRKWGITFNWTQRSEKFAVGLFYGQIRIPHEILYKKVNDAVSKRQNPRIMGLLEVDAQVVCSQFFL
jgi:hypothetical protein